ncbi:LacI family transcriptional regulator [Saccharopolyspora rhizosphaerae]|uniref:LacI family transcriptional regulator n=1 Tax=Saccharopolyspora rhizosphaerae TaxID=2492662 RepID=A0A3R8P3A3_9PSEU|nr:LacI family DNA-binding transcriptional regulator [Saccharopolyspora rhizosphaerae]RRO18671.1 LacI family transcriptional regulator [Saccharopolyspora rhizosphaerae]
MSRATTLEQVAERAGVSRQTVSNALNAPEKLRPETLERVRQVIDELGYRPDTRARGLRTRSSGLLGYCVAQRQDGSVNVFMDRFLRALTTEVERTGRHLLLFTAPEGEAGLSVYDDLLARSAVDGFVLSDTRPGDPRHAWLRDKGVPFASFGRVWSDEPQPGPWVDVDGASGTAQAVEHLVAQGHTSIGFLGLPEGNPVGDDRAAGWRRACAEHGIEAGERMLARSADEHRDRGEAAGRLLDSEPRPTALVAANDAIALGAYEALEARGVRPGLDVALTGFDDSPTAAVVRPGLTSLHQPIDRIAERVVRLLDRPEGEPGELLRPELIVRASSSSGNDDGGQS